MGGQTSEVSPTTKRVLLESAMFEPKGVRRTARRHGLHTEASHRFERGMDEQTAAFAADRCAELMVELAGGRVFPGAIDRYPSPKAPTRVWVRPARVSAVLGARVPPAEVEQRLESIGLRPLEGDEERRLWAVPSWRGDLTREIDCAEEVARLRGYDTIPITIHPAGVGETAAIRAPERATAAGRAALAAHGFDEVINYSFVAERDLSALYVGQSSPAVIRVANPLTAEQGAMRLSFLPGLLRNVGYNLARGAHTLQLYELGRIYLPMPDPRHPQGPLAWPAYEANHLGLAMTGRKPKSWTGGGEPFDFYDLKGAIEDLLEAMGIEGVRFAPAQGSAFHPATSTELLLDGRRAGLLGQAHPQVTEHFEVPPQTWLAELNWDSLLGASRPLKSFHGVPKFPAVERDLAFVVDDGVPAEKLLEEIRGADSAHLLEEVTLFDLYRGAPVPEGKKSMAFGLTLRAADRTLTDAEADALIAGIRARLEKNLGARIRA
jgi:phenylalanyl-tRNA synthetase beta chain